MTLRLPDLWRCFQGVLPSIVATSDGSGVPNITYVSQIFLVDNRHVALSCQFFNKTRRNLDENPDACAEVLDPVTFQAYRLRLRFLRSEKSGPLFDTMTLIQTRKVRRIPCVLLGKAYYAPLVSWMRDTMLEHAAIAKEDLDLWLLTDSPHEATEYLDHHIVNQTWWAQKTP